VASADQQLAISLNLNYLAQLYLNEGRYAEAEPLFKRALAIGKKLLEPNDPDLMTSITSQKVREGVVVYVTDLNNLGALYYNQGRYAEAELLDKRALAIGEKLLGADATRLNNLGTLYRAQGRYAEAEPLFKRALTINEKAHVPGNPLIAYTLTNLALLNRLQGRYAEAEQLYKRVLEIREKLLGPNHPDVARSLTGIAEVYREQGLYTTALPFIRRAAAITSTRAASAKENSKGGQSELRSRGIVFLDEASVTTHLDAAKDPQSAQLREEGFAALQWSKASDTAAAVAHMAARFAAASDALANLIRQRQDTQDRFDATETLILKAVSQPSDRVDAKAIADLRAQAIALHQRLKTHDDELAVKFPAYAELANPKPVTIAETQKLLAPDQALIVFAIGYKESYVAVVGHDNYEIDIVPIGAEDLSAAVKALRKTLDPNGFIKVPPFDARTAYKLYQQLLAPAEPALKNVTQLYVVTDGALDSLPLGVLLTEEPSANTLSAPEELRAAPWFALRYAISVLPSVSSLKALRQFAANSHAPQPFMGIGDPLLKNHPPAGQEKRGAVALAPAIDIKDVFRGGRVNVAVLRDLPSLPETAGELAAEAKLFKAGDDALLLRDAATVTAVKKADLASRRVIAFATHGLLAGDVGIAEPGLVMTPPAPGKETAKDDGLLKASEIAQLKLNADLVILSACNTAASDGTPGAEGFSGLSKAFIYAGARSLLVSHWEVDSDSTVALMTDIATHLETEGVGRAEALRRAEVHLMNDPTQPRFAHPVYWAPFVVVGEGGASKE
jgi:CHAT domain-containing protein/Tfp pilus assembly protein PilF